MILAYLAIFRLEDLGYNKFCDFVYADDPTKMHVFLGYLFSSEILNGVLKDEWCRIFDQTFVEVSFRNAMVTLHVCLQDTLIAGLLKYSNEMDVLLADLEVKAFGVAAARAAKESQENALPAVVKKKKTMVNSIVAHFPPVFHTCAFPTLLQFVPFNLTQPRPRLVPEPIKIERVLPLSPSLLHFLPHQLAPPYTPLNCGALCCAVYSASSASASTASAAFASTSTYVLFRRRRPARSGL